MPKRPKQNSDHAQRHNTPTIDYVDDEWDRQMKQDAKFGKWNKLVQQARADIAANRVKTLNEILDDS